ncbi:hypothetical protein AVEN_266167-1 [Araneus ventricosus]|uniref:Uncharacterized protein n=1 Tax=Araneus ventricosus TaxID=182803 RepID=A0A4Y2VKK5_ARAVE|nr:hypothetical protein AVEN_266167-1 [Araneus ventricosus]
MVVEAYMPSVHQNIETGIEETRVQIVETLNDGFLNFGVGSEMATYQVLLKWSEDMKITRCEIRAIGRLFQCLCGGRARQFCTPVFVKVNRCFHTYLRALRSLRKLPLDGDENQVGMFSLNVKSYYTSHFNRRSCIR